MTWTLPGAILFLLALLLLLGYFLSKKIFTDQDEGSTETKSSNPVDCESCGVEGCGGFAKALVRGGEGHDSSESHCAIQASVEKKPDRKAIIHCCGRHVTIRYHYAGHHSCRAAASMSTRPRECANACLGFGDCCGSCPTRAIRIRDGVAEIDLSRCNGCGDCLKACPLSLIALIPCDNGLGMTCRGPQGPLPDWQCPDGCTLCHQCLEACPEGALKKADPAPPLWIPEKCTGCGQCRDACPQAIIIQYRLESPQAAWTSFSSRETSSRQ